EAVARVAEAQLGAASAGAFTGLSMADAECARGKLIALHTARLGPPIGYKAAATGAAAQRNFGLAAPVWGALFADAVGLRDGAEVALGPALSGLGVEADLLVRVRDEGINGAGRDPVAVLRHLDQVIPYIELPKRGVGGALDGPGLVAINASARLGVVGAPIPVEATEGFAARLADMTVVFADDTRELAREPGRALMGHPLNVIPWLVEDLARAGLRLKAGDIVSLGGFAPSIPAQPGRTYTLRYEGLAAEPVSVAVAVR
ncbi:MAG: fumarylacetoacetate hydrolase, partial [Acetobacteraceae bacterium]|nr:fumarylacetoacetate hydrolase [Acetobacteraceae bacterium]